MVFPTNVNSIRRATKNAATIFPSLVLNTNPTSVELFILSRSEKLKKEKIVIDGNDRDKNGKDRTKRGSKKIYLKYGLFTKSTNLHECSSLVLTFKSQKM